MPSRLDVHFSSRNDEWETPHELFEELNLIFNFNLDACASPNNAKCRRYFTKRQNALKQRWRGNVWMNPPYGSVIELFMRKAYYESLRGTTVVCLVPNRPGTKWWRRYAMRGERYDLPGRLKFGGAQSSAPFPSAIVIFWGGVLAYASRPEPLEEGGV